MNSREISLNILNKFDKDKAFINALLFDAFKKNDLSEADKGLTNQIVLGCVKNRYLLDFFIMQFSKVKIKKMSISVRNILEMGTYQIVFLDKVPDSAACNESVKLAKKYASRSSGFINAVLRKIAGNKENLKYPEKSDDAVKFLSVMYSYPEWIIRKLIDDYDFEFCEKIFEAANKSYSPTIRANILLSPKTEDGELDTEKFIEILSEDGINIIPHASINGCFLVSGRLDIIGSKSYDNGLFTIQNSSSQLASLELNPSFGDTVIDICAAPGGKTTHLAEMMSNKGIIYAFDVHEHKIRIIENTAKRLKIDIIDAKLGDGTVLIPELVESADKILIDAPCSGFGVIHTKPDIKWHRDEEDVKVLADIQHDILKTASRYLKKNGTLVYSTCTIFKDENEYQISRFLAENPSFKLVSERKLFTHIDGGSGFYIAKLIKI